MKILKNFILDQRTIIISFCVIVLSLSWGVIRFIHEYKPEKITYQTESGIIVEKIIAVKEDK
jgi:hypothetical protein